MKTEEILEERQGTHGDFSDNARVSQAMKTIMRNEATYNSLSDVQKEALDMIVHKIARILAGDADFNDHWDDLSGYPQLVSDRLVQHVDNSHG